ncbi:GLUG motif-containing protein, partial [Dysosmobacter sp.]|uniref:GLUG motif-containing protein n=1 Tax=Dysosmobacter sp. TaxID=2591382 RepID=UPI00307CE4B2
MKHIQKWSALLMAVTLLFTLAAPAALATESTVTIKTAEDLAELSRNCTLDTWSQGKTVILENDLDLHGIDFTPIPTFSGTFQGNGHTISGLTLTGSGNVRGLFRYIQTGATVQDLTVTGTIHPNGHQDDLGLLAGSNAGRILNCIASGTVMGDNRIGGLVGVNETGGELVGCAFSGSVTGKHSTAGVVGENRGTLTRCSNSGSINTQDLEDAPKTDYTNLAQLNSMENVPAYTDVGGVAGYSKGTIQSCSNSGSVGYDQIGY